MKVEKKQLILYTNIRYWCLWFIIEKMKSLSYQYDLSVEKATRACCVLSWLWFGSILFGNFWFESPFVGIPYINHRLPIIFTNPNWPIQIGRLELMRLISTLLFTLVTFIAAFLTLLIISLYLLPMWVSQATRIWLLSAASHR